MAQVFVFIACIISKKDIQQNRLSVVTYKSGSVEGLAVDKVAGKESVKSVFLITKRPSQIEAVIISALKRMQSDRHLEQRLWDINLFVLLPILKNPEMFPLNVL
jgi:hypothetical protein